MEGRDIMENTDNIGPLEWLVGGHSVNEEAGEYVVHWEIMKKTGSG